MANTTKYHNKKYKNYTIRIGRSEKMGVKIKFGFQKT